jgi:hypothetical protein
LIMTAICIQQRAAAILKKVSGKWDPDLQLMYS